ncbi:hypothetical protein BS330_23175 [Amycolatopsis keratiniphila subsp. nogabecina]|uniref:Uncharacterized protein n=1 Tax=Amycolatopsis keratiniphila subsp. keratiniphila TaxID=227715 RepID=A0A1W2LL86_9PSEU|nr:hypothetical protein BS330_23175 [Amycolatopsis keratiniphila subsp. nogabecina]ONF63402.1 hypothetical protein AVR91_0233145 [Amycolatopsis keratiniphila subsp. keratiniphila]SDU08612.1 hypothetical protein SAMN04489733_1013 [Amycolatopsis keratiniphila]
MPTRQPRPFRHFKATQADTRRKETYAEQQARLDAEALDRWAAIVADLPPLTDDQITSLAVILNRIDKRRRTADTERNDEGRRAA